MTNTTTEPVASARIIPNEYYALEGQTVCVMHMFAVALALSLKNRVLYITDDEVQYNRFKKLVVNNKEFGNDDNALLVKNGNKNYLNQKLYDNVEKFLQMNGKKKFDCCIMNPPYDGSLHLKIISCILPYAKEIVNISPVRWLQDPLAEYKKSSDFKKYEAIRANLKISEIIPAQVASRLFGIDLTFSLGIYSIKESNEGIKTPMIDERTMSVYKKIIERIVNDNNYDKLTIKKYDDALDNYVCAANFSPESKYGKKRFFFLKDVGKAFTNGYTYRKYKDGNRFATRGNIQNTECILFNTAEEAQNCYNSFKMLLPKFICMLSTVDVNIYPQFAPWMLDYTAPWTNERFCKHFCITGFIDDEHAEPNSEWEIILNTMKEYK